MDNRSTHEVRLVKCPKCLRLLPEPADVTVYGCGGCGAVLQVKNRKKDAKGISISSGSHELGAAKKSELDHVSEVTQSISSSQKGIPLSSGESSLIQNSVSDQNISTEICSSDEEQNNEDDQIESQDCNIEQPGVSNEICSLTRSTYHESEELSPVSGPYSEVEVNNESAVPGGEKSVADVNNESGSTYSSSNADNAVGGMDINSTITSHRPGKQSISSDILISSPDEHHEQLQPSVNDRYDHIRSNDPLETTNFFSISSEFSGNLDYLSKSPTTRSSNAYDGSVSSYDGIDDQIPNEQINLYKKKYKVLNSDITQERSRTDNFLKNRNTKLQHRERNFSPVLSDTMHYPLNLRNLGQEEPAADDPAVRNGTGLERDGSVSSVPFYQRNYPTGYESGSSSSQLLDEFHLHSSEQNKVKLLRMVYELQDQLNKRCYVNEMASTMFSPGVIMKEKHIPAYYGGEMPEGEICHDINYLQHSEIRRQESSWSHQFNVPRVHFTAETTKNRHHVDSSCMHCRPQDWKRLAPLPPPIPSHNKGFRRIHPDQSWYSSYRSCPSSPQRSTDSEFPIWCRETVSDDQMHEGHRMKKFMKEKHHSVKRHLRPTVGGAPFVICYICLKPLQLPADFLLFKRKFHQLRCGACSEVLKFSLENRTQILPYTPNAVAPPPNEIDDDSDAINKRNSTTSSHANDYPHADPVSCSDDYGLPYCKSYSTDGDSVLSKTFHNVRGSANARDISYGSSDSMEERKKLVLKQSRNKDKNVVESAGPSSSMSRSMKVSSEIEELPAKIGSPLHRLMGYSSPSQVIRGYGPY